MINKEGRIINRVKGIKSLALFLAVASVMWVSIIFIGLISYGVENTIEPYETAIRISLYSIPCFIIIYLSYVLYRTTNINRAKAALLLLAAILSIYVLASIVAIDWLGLFIAVIYYYELYRLYKKVCGLESTE